MTQTSIDFDSEHLPESENNHLFQPSYYWQLVKRRWLYLVLPSIAIIALGASTVMLWPAVYLSEGKILVQSQQIPTELVRPTVTSAAQERIQVIEQRTMTRDNLIAIVDKFKLFPQKRDFMSPTDLLLEVRKRAKITAIDQTLDFKQRSRQDNPTIVFSVGFEYDSPQIAAQVANELITRILSEDLRDRTSRANDTTKFLAREVERLRAENVSLEERITRAKPPETRPSQQAVVPDQSSGALNQLRVELAQKSALYSPRHPSLQLIKKQIEALEAARVATPAAKPGTPDAPVENRDLLLAQQEALQKNIEVTMAKLSAARLGETLEKDQQSEKLEVIEQPTVPQQPIRPNRSKMLGLVVLGGIAAGFGLALLREFADKSIRRASDLSHLFDNRILISIPLITTAAEQRAMHRRLFAFVALFIIAIVGAAVATYVLLPLDLIIAKARVGIFR